MYIIVYKYLDQTMSLVAKNKTVGMRGLKELQVMGLGHVWRAHDDTGWSDGSPDAGKEIYFLPTNNQVTYIFR